MLQVESCGKRRPRFTVTGALLAALVLSFLWHRDPQCSPVQQVRPHLSACVCRHRRSCRRCRRCQVLLPPDALSCGVALARLRAAAGLPFPALNTDNCCTCSCRRYSLHRSPAPAQRKGAQRRPTEEEEEEQQQQERQQQQQQQKQQEQVQEQEQKQQGQQQGQQQHEQVPLNARSPARWQRCTSAAGSRWPSGGACRTRRSLRAPRTWGGSGPGRRSRPSAARGSLATRSYAGSWRASRCCSSCSSA